MKILYVCSLYSGFEQSIRQGEWDPAGAPTAYKLIEALDQSEHRLRLVLCCRGTPGGFASLGGCDRELGLKGLDTPIQVLAGEARFPAGVGRLRAHLSQFRQLWAILREAWRCKPDLVYVDRANVMAGALLALLGWRVVLRVMGVTPEMRTLPGSRHPLDRLHYLSYKAPFSLVLCTRDGSGGESWLRRHLRRGVRLESMVNGVDYREVERLGGAHPGAPGGPMKVLFTGRLEAIKGCEEFVEAMLRLPTSVAQRVHALIVGGGPLEEALQRRVAQAGGGKRITFLGHLSHARMLQAYAGADVFVSLNRMGNLSNVVLEALVSGLCTIIPHSRRESGIDLETDEVLPEGAVIRLPEEGEVQALADVVQMLAASPERCRTYGRAARRVAEDFIPTWDERVAAEMKMLTGLVEADGADSP